MNKINNFNNLIKNFIYLQGPNYRDYQKLIQWWKKEINSKETLYQKCKSWINKHKPTTPESLIQVDLVNTALPELAKNICDEIGYYDCENK